MTHIFYKEFETLNWLPMIEGSTLSINLNVFKEVNNESSNYQNEVFQTALENNIQTSGSFLKLKCLFHKTNAGQMVLS